MADRSWVSSYERGDGTAVSGHARRVHRFPRERTSSSVRPPRDAAVQMASGGEGGVWVRLSDGADLFVGPHGDYSGVRLRELSLDGVDLSDCSLHLVTFARVSLRGAMLGGGDLRGLRVSDCDLEGASVCGSDIFGSVFQYSNLRDLDARGAVFGRAVFSNCDLRGVDWRDAEVGQITVSYDRPTREVPYHQYSFLETAELLDLDVDEVGVLAWSGVLDVRDNETLMAVGESVDAATQHVTPWAIQNYRRS